MTLFRAAVPPVTKRVLQDQVLGPLEMAIRGLSHPMVTIPPDKWGGIMQALTTAQVILMELQRWPET